MSGVVGSWRKIISEQQQSAAQLNELISNLSEQDKIDLRDAVDVDDDARNLLMQACAAGNVQAVEFLLIECDAQRQWNALDANGLSAADLIPPNHPDIDTLEQLLLNAACRTELLLQVVFANAQEDEENSDDAPSQQEESFLTTPLRYEQGTEGVRLMTGSTAGSGHDDAVMMTWEKDIMRMHVERFVAHGCKTVLNVGFGLGIIDGLIEELADDQLVEHVIIEAHPDVLRHMREQGWMDRARVTVLEGTWQSQMSSLVERGATFDCVFFDTFETLDDMREFHEQLISVLAPDGLYSFFNGLCGTNRFLHKFASTVNPTLPSQTGVPHARVIANQDVQVEWVNGHDSDCYWILTPATDGIKNLRKTNTALLEDYINNGPAAQQVPPPARWQKYHRKYNNFNLDNKAGDAFFQAAIKPTDNNPNYIPRPDNFEGSFSGAPGGKGENGNVSLFMQMVYYQNTSCTMNDRRVQYNNPLYPWIIAVHRYRLCTGQGSRPDVARLTFPPGTKPGHYMAQWQWRGYYDVVDVEIVSGTTPVVKPYGDKVPEPPKGMRAQYKRVDHCAFPDAQPVKGCYRIMTDADACMRMCDRATEFACTGVQITPVLPRSSVYAGFRNITFMPYDFPSNCRKTDIERGALPGHFACWPLQARPRTDTVDRFVISLDPDDPVFYSTCLTRISYKVASGNVTVAPEPRELAWQFGKKCISCNSAVAATVEYAQPLWNITDSCANCDVDKRTVAQLPAAEKPVNFTVPAAWKTPQLPFKLCRGMQSGNYSESINYSCVNTTNCGIRLNTPGGAQQADISELDCQQLAKADARCSSLVTLYYEPSLERNFCTCFRGSYKNDTGDMACCGECVQQNTTAQWRAFENS